jgi:hypothetical protein
MCLPWRLAPPLAEPSEQSLLLFTRLFSLANPTQTQIKIKGETNKEEEIIRIGGYLKVVNQTYNAYHREFMQSSEPQPHLAE